MFGAMSTIANGGTQGSRVNPSNNKKTARRIRIEHHERNGHQQYRAFRFVDDWIRTSLRGYCSTVHQHVVGRHSIYMRTLLTISVHVLYVRRIYYHSVLHYH